MPHLQCDYLDSQNIVLCHPDTVRTSSVSNGVKLNLQEFRNFKPQAVLPNKTITSQGKINKVVAEHIYSEPYKVIAQSVLKLKSNHNDIMDMVWLR